MLLSIYDLKKQNLLLFEAVSGSKAYGLDLPHSDTDLKGVFYLPKDYFYGGNYILQISNPSNDEVYFELGRFIELLLQSNPNMLELLAMPPECIRYRHPLMDLLKPEFFLSKQCLQSFAGYAYGQIKKARGLNKKIVNPLPKKKKSLLEFCFIIENAKTISLSDWLKKHRITQHELGLVKLDHARNLYALFVDDGRQGYQGLIKNEQDSVLLLSRIPEDQTATTYLFFNQEGFSSYCKDYQSYWQWVAERNEDRYRTNQQHGKNYDAKNLMHTFRLLQMAREIALYGEIRVKRDNREELLAIRRGEFEYDELIAKAKTLMKEIEDLFARCSLPDDTDKVRAISALIEIRKQFYADEK